MPANEFTRLNSLPEDVHTEPLRFICMTNRTGSTWLCEMLNQSGLGYVAGEWFKAANERVPFAETPEGCAAQWEKLLAEHRVSGTRLVIKCSLRQMKMFQPLIGAELLRKSRFVFLRREDLLGQAISQFLLELNKKLTEDEIDVHRIDPERIVYLLRHYERGNEQWPKWLQQNVSHITSVRYETMLENPLPVLRQVISHLDSAGLCEQMRSDVELSGVRQRNQVPFAAHWREAIHRYQTGDDSWRDALVAPVEGKLRLG